MKSLYKQTTVCFKKTTENTFIMKYRSVPRNESVIVIVYFAFLFILIVKL